MVEVKVMSLNDLEKALQKSWTNQTAAGKWTPECPSMNQCAVTALVVQDYMGGYLLRCECSDEQSHYWNALPDGREVDLTEAQFAYTGVKAYKTERVVRDREYVLSYSSTYHRYRRLRKRVKQALREMGYAA